MNQNVTTITIHCAVCLHCVVQWVSGVFGVWRPHQWEFTMAFVDEEVEIERIRQVQQQYPSRKFTDSAFPCSDKALFANVRTAQDAEFANLRSCTRRTSLSHAARHATHVVHGGRSD